MLSAKPLESEKRWISLPLFNIKSPNPSISLIVAWNSSRNSDESSSLTGLSAPIWYETENNPTKIKNKIIKKDLFILKNMNMLDYWII